MKTLFMGMILISLNTWCFGDERPTIDSLIGKRIHIEDAFAGQSFTLLKGRKGKQEYIVEWIRSGTGVPSIRSHKCKVLVISNYQFRFILDHPEEKHGEFTLSITSKDEIKVFLNGIRIHIDGIGDARSLKSGRP